MSNDKTQTEKPGLEEAIDKCLSEMMSYPAHSAEFAKMVEQLDTLSKIQATNKPDRASRDALLAIVGNLAGIGMILSHERIHVVTSKALSFVMKSRA